MTTDLKKECAKRIKEIVNSITGQDKLDACEKIHVSRPTLDKYLDGEIANVDLAITIIEFFSGRISEKLARLEGAKDGASTQATNR